MILIDAAAYILPPPDSGGRLTVEDSRLRQRADSVIASVVGYFDLPNDTICAYIGGGEVAVLKASSTQDLEAWTDRVDSLEQVIPSWANLTALKRAVDGLLARLRRDALAPITIGIGRYHPGLRGLGRSYQDARAALSLGKRFHGPNQVHCLDGLGVASFVGVSDEATKVDLAAHLLSPLDHEPSCSRRWRCSLPRTAVTRLPRAAWRSTGTPLATGSTRSPPSPVSIPAISTTRCRFAWRW